MRSTPEMRARIRELMTDPQDDYDRAVECVLNDFEALEAARAVDLQTCADQLEQNTATMNTAADRIEALEAENLILKTKSDLAVQNRNHWHTTANSAADRIETLEKVALEQSARINEMRQALREIKDQYLEPNQSSAIAKVALAPGQDKP